jgi:hypothetical protein
MAGANAVKFDEKRIIDAVNSMNPHGNEEGIIDAFGVYLTNHYADYYNRISYKFELAVKEYDKAFLDLVTPLLIMSGHVCGYNTFGGIRRSDAWKSLIAPMCSSKEDEIRGLVAVLNALGWGVWKVISIAPTKLVIRSNNTYESTGYLKEFGKRKNSGCFLALGVAISFMNIIYSSRDVMTEDLLANEFTGTETRCRSKGDSYCEFTVIRK